MAGNGTRRLTRTGGVEEKKKNEPPVEDNQYASLGAQTAGGSGVTRAEKIEAKKVLDDLLEPTLDELKEKINLSYSEEETSSYVSDKIFPDIPSVETASKPLSPRETVSEQTKQKTSRAPRKKIVAVAAGGSFATNATVVLAHFLPEMPMPVMAAIVGLAVWTGSTASGYLMPPDSSE